MKQKIFKFFGALGIALALFLVIMLGVFAGHSISTCDVNVAYATNSYAWQYFCSDLRISNGDYLWSDGTNVYYDYSPDSIHLVLDVSNKQWTAYTSNININGDGVWSDGTNIYYSSNTNQYVLNGSTWVSKSWTGLTNFTGSYVWNIGSTYYYSQSTNQYVLNGSTWSAVSWTGVTSPDGRYIWSDGTNVYYDYVPVFGSGNHAILSGTNWSSHTWTNYAAIAGNNIFIFNNTYYFCFTSLYKLTNGVWNASNDLPSRTSGNFYFTVGGKNYCVVSGATLVYDEVLDTQSYYNAGYAAGYTAGESAGYTDGYSAGQTAGYNSGYTAGSHDGELIGYANGYTEGYDDGYDRGESAGYTSGYSAGRSAGYQNGYSVGYAAGVASVDTQAYYDDGYDDGYDEGFADGVASMDPDGLITEFESFKTAILFNGLMNSGQAGEMAYAYFYYTLELVNNQTAMNGTFSIDSVYGTWTVSLTNVDISGANSTGSQNLALIRTGSNITIYVNFAWSNLDNLNFSRYMTSSYIDGTYNTDVHDSIAYSMGDMTNGGANVSFDIKHNLYSLYSGYNAALEYYRLPYSLYFLRADLADNELYQSGYNTGYNAGESAGYQSGYSEGYIDGDNHGYNTGYGAGYNQGTEDANEYTFLKLVGSVIDAPVQAFTNLFNFDVFGVNMADFLLGLFSIALVITVVKFLLVK